jgi:hypothetical protein
LPNATLFMLQHFVGDRKLAEPMEMVVCLMNVIKPAGVIPYSSSPVHLRTNFITDKSECYTAYFHIRWKTTRISESDDNTMHEIASLHKGPGISLHMHQEALRVKDFPGIGGLHVVRVRHDVLDDSVVW